MTKKFRKKPAIVEAVQWDGRRQTANRVLGNNYGADWYYASDYTTEIVIPIRGGRMFCRLGDWIVKRADGVLDVCKPDIFAATYEPLEEEGNQ